MSEAKHTPGPWRACRFQAADTYHGEVCTVGMMTPLADVKHIDGDRNREMAEANARLIAAAPDLLAACEEIQDAMSKYGAQLSELFGHDEQFNAAVEAVDAAIAKAKGLTPDL